MTVTKADKISTLAGEKSYPHSTTNKPRRVTRDLDPTPPPKDHQAGINQSTVSSRRLSDYSPGRAAAIAVRNDEAVAVFLDYRALLQAGAVEGNPHSIDVPAVLEAIKGDPTFGPRSRKALWDELDQVERDRLKAAGQGVAGQ